MCNPRRWLQWKFFYASYLTHWTYFMKLTWWLYLIGNKASDIATTLSYCSELILKQSPSKHAYENITNYHKLVCFPFLSHQIHNVKTVRTPQFLKRLKPWTRCSRHRTQAVKQIDDRATGEIRTRVCVNRVYAYSVFLMKNITISNPNFP